MLDERDLEVAVRTLARFISDAPLTTTIAELEHDLDGRRKDEVEAIIRARGFSSDLLRGAMLIRSRLGRINDLIHATAITLALSELMTPERGPASTLPRRRQRPIPPVRRVETDRGVAEFKLSRWDGSDAMRKR